MNWAQSHRRTVLTTTVTAAVRSRWSWRPASVDPRRLHDRNAPRRPTFGGHMLATLPSNPGLLRFAACIREPVLSFYNVVSADARAYPPVGGGHPRQSPRRPTRAECGAWVRSRRGGKKQGGAAYAYARVLIPAYFLTQAPPCAEKMLRLRLGQKLTAPEAIALIYRPLNGPSRTAASTPKDLS